MATTNNKIQKKTGPKSVEELQRKGPPTREEIEAISEKYGMGVALTPDENDRYFLRIMDRKALMKMIDIYSISHKEEMQTMSLHS